MTKEAFINLSETKDEDDVIAVDGVSNNENNINPKA
ncbi:hypothetical protein PPL_00055 [Heterostelium album PN500]|uniref:Uncharacterized protein n=1 Tax=Heterostelium pallidum (strain ATCC 26659 / Pp 5 / PN500) TaxID=670386 RepID=D3BVQ4_HETP5|nr:hypothetical protein PPL_00055 [Heterostelium album PN500]EFA74557.1 hypothetical protein PPL_00055 [Heterostelium album PN500]|eukprot:XP_020426691.1 hypothetical protein PPL_00055 [Heterostelium album PN500]